MVEEYENPGPGFALARRYLLGPGLDQPILMDKVGGPGAGPYYYLRNRQGSVLALAAVDGSVAESYTYSAYGRQRLFDNAGTEIPLSAAGNPYGYTGRRLDPESGLLHYRNRYHSPALGRFLTRDPAGFVDGPNLYAYVRSNPLAFVDPWGLAARGVLGKTVDWLGENFKRSIANTLDPIADAAREWGKIVDGRPALKEFLEGGDLIAFECLRTAQSNGPTPDDPLWGIAALTSKAVSLTGKGTQAAKALDRVADALTATNRYRIDDALQALNRSDDPATVVRHLGDLGQGSKPYKPGDVLPDGRIAGNGPGAALKGSAGESLKSNVGSVADSLDLTPRQVKDAIHSAKNRLPKSGPTRNPDVVIDVTTGEIYPKIPGGGIGDSIGNIWDNL